MFENWAQRKHREITNNGHRHNEKSAKHSRRFPSDHSRDCHSKILIRIYQHITLSSW